MKHITEEYGQQTNLLTLTADDYWKLEPFLKALGIRTRMTKMYGNEVTIQGDNPYKHWLALNRRLNQGTEVTWECAERDMSEFGINCYKR